MIELSTIREDVDHTLFHRLAGTLVELGYYPDYTNLTLYPETPQGSRDFDAALSAIRTLKGFAIEVFGTGTNQAKYVKKVPRMVIMSGPYSPGNVGSNPDVFYESNLTFGKDAKVLPPQTSNYRFDIAIAANTSKQERLMQAVIAELFPLRQYLKFYNDPNAEFLILRTGDRQFSDLNQGILDKVYSYQAIDLFESNTKTIATDVPLLKEVNVQVQVNAEPETEILNFNLNSSP
jgi:hypothetical protein